MKVINFVAGPGTGKSTTAAGVFSYLKWSGVNAELVTEYAKTKVWEKSTNVLYDQPYLIGKQHHKLWILKEQVEVALTDSPLFLCTYYGRSWGDWLEEYVMRLFYLYDNEIIFLGREKEYNPSGRLQSEEEAKSIDSFLYQKLNEYGLDFHYFEATHENVNKIGEFVLGKLGK